MARRFPELSGVPWFPAIGDGAASNLGSGAMRPGLAAINVGTSAALRVVLERTPTRGPLAPFGLFCYRVDDRRGLLGGAVSNAGNLRAWVLREMKLPESAAMEKAFAARPGPVEGLTLLPFWIAERAPTWPEEMPSVVAGITQATTALDLLQALQEATYLRLARIAEAVEKAAGRRLAFIVSGGIHNSPESLRRLANVLGRPVYPSAEPEASLRGAACFAMEKAGLKPAAVKLGGGDSAGAENRAGVREGAGKAGVAGNCFKRDSVGTTVHAGGDLTPQNRLVEGQSMYQYHFSRIDI